MIIMHVINHKLILLLISNPNDPNNESSIDLYLTLIYFMINIFYIISQSQVGIDSTLELLQ